MDGLPNAAFVHDNQVDVIAGLLGCLFVVLANGLIFNHLVAAEDNPRDGRQHLLDGSPHVTGDDRRTVLLERDRFWIAIVERHRLEPVL